MVDTTFDPSSIYGAVGMYVTTGAAIGAMNMARRSFEGEPRTVRRIQQRHKQTKRTQMIRRPGMYENKWGIRPLSSYSKW